MSGVGLTFPLCCFHPAVAANNTPLIVNQHRPSPAGPSPEAIAGSICRSVARMKPHFRGEGFSSDIERKARQCLVVSRSDDLRAAAFEVSGGS
jgi:hypothetical protein